MPTTLIHHVQVRLTAEEYEAWVRGAKDAGMNMSEWLRDVVARELLDRAVDPSEAA